jgi:3-dehydroquinate dehydratase-2
MTIYILNGPNLNLLGAREPEIYGATTLAEIRADAERWAAEKSRTVDFRQTNHEGVLIDWVQEAAAGAAGLIINPAGYTHTSVALGDALAAAALPKIELHLSNVHRREAFRRHSYASPAVDAVICGFGAAGYRIALDAMSALTDKKSRQ